MCFIINFINAQDLSPDWLYDFRTYLRNHGLTGPLESKSTQTTAKTGTAAKANKASQGGKQAQTGEGPKVRRSWKRNMLNRDGRKYRNDIR